MSCSTNAKPLGGSELVEHDEQGQAHRVGQQRLLLRVEVPVRDHHQIGQLRE
ncbi:MAG TPA: hypothetical protein VFZ37_19320 [Jiangellaceae bacterium]